MEPAGNPPPSWSPSDPFRETFLQQLPSPEHEAAFRTAGEALGSVTLLTPADAPRAAEPCPVPELRAFAAELRWQERHLQHLEDEQVMRTDGQRPLVERTREWRARLAAVRGSVEAEVAAHMAAWTAAGEMPPAPGWLEDEPPRLAWNV